MGQQIRHNKYPENQLTTYMKIAFIVNKFPALSETFILNQITGLIDKGHDVDIFANFVSDDSKIHADVKKYHLIDKTHYFHIPNTRIDRVEYTIKICLENLFSHPLSLLKFAKLFQTKNVYQSLNNLFLLKPFLNKQYDIIHCHFGTIGKDYLFLKELLNVKYVTTFHGYDITMVLQKNGINYYNDLMENGDLFLPISDNWKRKLIEMRCREEKIIVHRMGINTDYFKFKPRRIKHNEKIKLLTIARLAEKKGIKFAIKAVAKVLQKYPNLEYRIAGDGPLMNDLHKLIMNLGVQNKISLLGWMTHSEVQNLMEQAHIFVLPSVTSHSGDQEGIPVVLMEAQAIGLPVISTQHSGIPELVVDGKSGFLMPERDVEALAEKLQYLIEHLEVWPEMGRYGRDFVEKHYDINKLNKRLVKIYQDLQRS